MTLSTWIFLAPFDALLQEDATYGILKIQNSRSTLFAHISCVTVTLSIAA